MRQAEMSDAYQYRPGLNPEFARRARANNAKRRAEERARLEAAEQEKKEKARLLKQREAQEALAKKAKKRDFLNITENYAMLSGEYEVHSAMMPSEIIRAVARANNMHSEELTGACKIPPVKNARWDAIALIKYLKPKYSYVDIGRFMGGKDHTSIRYALQKRGFGGGGWTGGKPALESQAKTLRIEGMDD